MLETFVLGEWHLDVNVVLNTWTWEMLETLVEARVRRGEREREAIEAARNRD